MRSGKTRGGRGVAVSPGRNPVKWIKTTAENSIQIPSFQFRLPLDVGDQFVGDVAVGGGGVLGGLSCGAELAERVFGDVRVEHTQVI